MDGTAPPAPTTLGTAFERRTLRSARILAAVVAVAAFALAWVLRPYGLSPVVSIPAAGAAVWLAWRLATGKLRRRRTVLAQPFPPAWETVLLKDVAFFRALAEDERLRFRREMQIFLGETLVTGVGTEIDDRTRVLVGASAVIPIFGFPDWEWHQINEVLVYPNRFGRDFEFQGGDGRHVLGMVGTGAMNRLMILAKPDLVQGFRNAGDKRNVGLHEFAHLVDKSDGEIDGVPAAVLPREAIGPWIDLVRRKMQEIEDGESDLNPYALTNEAEFFSVATEYFFERPGIMKRKHPELFAMMQKVFDQDLASRVKDLRREIEAGSRKFGRNSPCPCGSGKKFKKCCLRK